MKKPRKNSFGLSKVSYFKSTGNQIFLFVILLITMLFVVPDAYAQQDEDTETDITKSVKRPGAMYYMAIFFDYKEGKTGRAMNFIRKHFLPVDKKVGRKVVVFNPMTGPWDEIAFFPLPNGPGALAWEISPADAKWNAAFVELAGSKERVAELWREYRTLVNKTKRMLVIQPVGWQYKLSPQESE